MSYKTELRAFLQANFILGAASSPLTDGDSFLEHHVLDSTGFLELITHLEEAYGIKVGDDEMIPENLDSLDALELFLTRKLAAPPVLATPA